MSNEAVFTIGDKVLCPATDTDGEPEMRVGTLIDLNSRWAKVETSQGVVRVGKTKIESLAFDDEDSEFGDEGGEEEEQRLIDPRPYTYEKVKAASGKSSLDNGDLVANFLRGKTLEEVYIAAAAVLEMNPETLQIAYDHLNPGHQRMCVGNKLRRSEQWAERILLGAS